MTDCGGFLGHTTLPCSYERFCPDPFHLMENVVNSTLWKPLLDFATHFQQTEQLIAACKHSSLKLFPKYFDSKGGIITQLQGSDGYKLAIFMGYVLNALSAKYPKNNLSTYKKGKLFSLFLPIFFN